MESPLSPIDPTDPAPTEPKRKARRPRRPRDSLEDMLADIWAATLGVDQVGIDDDFLALGGGGTQAEAIVRAVARDCGVRIEPADLHRAGTVRRLAVEIKERARPVVSQRCRSFPAAPGAAPFFFVHGDPNGAGLYCARLAGALGPDIALHALTPFGPYGPAPLGSVEAMARFHIDTLRAIAPHGPYLLGGFCLGGVVALEMARRLAASGEEVRRVILVAPKVWSRYYGLRRTLAWAGRRLRIDARVDARIFLWLMETVQPLFTGWDRRRARRHGIPPDRFPPARPLRDIEHPRKRKARGWVVGRKGGARSVARDSVEQARAAFSAELARVARVHVPARWPGRLTILRPEREAFPRFAEPEASWRQIAAELEVHTIPGGHTNSVATHVQAAGQRIAACLAGAWESRPA